MGSGKPPLRRCRCGRVHRAWRIDTYCTRCTKEEGRGTKASQLAIRAAFDANQARLRRESEARDAQG